MSLKETFGKIVDSDAFRPAKGISIEDQDKFMSALGNGLKRIVKRFVLPMNGEGARNAYPGSLRNSYIINLLKQKFKKK